jgi:hypothetical protein
VDLSGNNKNKFNQGSWRNCKVNSGNVCYYSLRKLLASHAVCNTSEKVGWSSNASDFDFGRCCVRIPVGTLTTINYVTAASFLSNASFSLIQSLKATCSELKTASFKKKECSVHYIQWICTKQRILQLFVWLQNVASCSERRVWITAKH